MNSPNPRDELPEALRSLVEDIANRPVPENLLKSARPLSVPEPKKTKPRSSGFAVAISVLALSLYIAALLRQEEPRQQPDQVVEEKQPIPPRPAEEHPPPTFWAYRQAHSAETLDHLLTQHAAALLPSTPQGDFPLFPSRKEGL